MDYPVIDVAETGRSIGTMIRRSSVSAPVREITVFTGIAVIILQMSKSRTATPKP